MSAWRTRAERPSSIATAGLSSISACGGRCYAEAQVGRAVRTQRWKYGVDAPEAHRKGLAGADQYKEQYLYDLQADPYELNNLIGLESHREVAQIMKERLLRRMKLAEEVPPSIIEAPEGRAGQRKVSIEEARS